MDLVAEILKLKKERDAVILAHNYQDGDIQDIADFVGDSLELSRKAAEVSESVIVFCGVHFMAETAKILAPEKTVLLPSLDAGCGLADMITAPQLREFKTEHPGAKVVCYVNSTAEVKAESDACCTSANAVRVVENIDADEVIMVPDKYLSAHVEEELRKKGVSKKIIAWNGYCPVHMKILPEYIERLKMKHPSAKIITHPECACTVTRLSDSVKSTSGMSDFVRESGSETFIIGTEVGLLHRLREEFPDKKFIPATGLAECKYMKEIDLHNLYESLRDMKHVIDVDPEVARKAKSAIDEMMKF
ncbi:quinolinate synthase NadA [Candidatus Peregrinibacteria bacterium]|jgi:quinolinate synthase|nr:quinolinate synthase NadA [Candidatus Peregrinibacteria bacterium]MBT4055514.1 quinolinate synthase NadA [Candidatus Peregrinibacteria bacterium]